MNGLIAHSLIFNEKGKFLIIKRSLIKRGKPNYQVEKWGIPGGTVEPGELPRDAVLERQKRKPDSILKLIILSMNRQIMTPPKTRFLRSSYMAISLSEI